MSWLWLVAATVGLAGTAAFAIWTNDHWATQSRGTRTLRLGCLALLAVVSYGAAESYLLGAPIGMRVPLVIAAYGVILTGLGLISRDHR